VLRIAQQIFDLPESAHTIDRPGEVGTVVRARLSRSLPASDGKPQGAVSDGHRPPNAAP